MSDQWDESYSLHARIVALVNERDALRKALEDMLPSTHGTFGGPLVGMAASYEDASEENNSTRHRGWISHKAVARARAVLAQREQP